jgi:hypothetical protein
LERLSLATKALFRWLHNKKVKEIDGEEEVKLEDEWETPSFLEQIIKRREKRNKKKTKAVNEFREQLFCIYLTKIDLKWWSNSVCC